MPPFASIANALKRTAKQPAGPSVENPARRFNTEDISVQLQRALTPLQIESLSLHNALGTLVWRNDGAFGDDEQAVVLDALDMFAIDEAREELRLKLDDDRSALFAIARDAARVMRGVALVIVETPASDELSAKLGGPRLQTQMRRFAQLLAPPPELHTAPLGQLAAAEAHASPAMDDAAETLLVAATRMNAEEFTVSPEPAALAFDATAATVESAQLAAPAYRAEEDLVESQELAKAQELAEAALLLETTQPVEPLLRLETTQPVEPLRPNRSPDVLDLLEFSSDEATQIAPVHLAARAAPAVPMERRARSSGGTPEDRASSIHARRYTRLRAGGAARRYEVKPSSSATYKGDLALTSMVASHMQRSQERYAQTPSTFVVPLSLESVTHGGWLAKVNSMLTRTGMPRGMLGFSLSPNVWQDHRTAAERFIAECAAIDCFVALDDFSLQHSGLGLLRSGAVKCLKLDPRIVAAVVNDRFAHAQIAATVQAARVLGLYCVAKQVTTTSLAKWLASAGIEFADGVGRGVIIAAAGSRHSTKM